MITPINLISKEWFEQQLKAGRDIKHIADYLGASRKDIEYIMRLHGLIQDPPLKPPPRKITFEEIAVGELVAHQGSFYTVMKRTETTITVKKHEKKTKLQKVTKKKWTTDKWKVKRDYDAPIAYNMNNLPGGEAELERYRTQSTPNIEYKKSLERALRGFA